MESGFSKVLNSIKVARLDDNAIVPKRMNNGDAGMDLFSNEDVEIAAGSRALVRTGIAVEIPYGYVGLVHPRSGLALRSGITVLNSPGTIDCQYRGEVGVLLFNTSRLVASVKAGDRIAQLLIQSVELPDVELVTELTSSSRGDNGWGSTGV